MNTQRQPTNIRIGIRTALIMGFGLIAVLLVCALGIALYAGNAVEVALKSTAEKTIPASNAAYEVSLEVSSIARSLRDSVLVESQEDLPKELERMSASLARINDLIGSLKNEVDTRAEKEALERVVEFAAAFEQDRKQFLYHIEGGERGPARGMLTGKLRVSQEEYLAALKDFRMDQSKRLAESTTAVGDTLSRMTISLAVSFCLLLLVAVFTGVGLVRMIKRRLGAEPHLVAAAMAQVAEGNLSDPLSHLQAPEGSVIDSMRSMVAGLRESVAEVRAASANVARKSRALVEESQNLSMRTEQQSAELEQAAAALEQFSATMDQSRQSISEAESLARTSSGVAVKSRELVDAAVGRMHAVADFGTEISSTTSVIDSISFQTNILALNAAVEAARAGDRGNGFAVVAGEVRNLAMNSADSAKQVRELINRSIVQIEECQKMISQAQAQSLTVIGSVDSFSTFMSRVLIAISEQTIGIRQLTEALSKIDQFTQKNAALVNESRGTAEELLDQSMRLVGAVSKFKADNLVEA